jgi:hypothetical protein
MYYKDVNNNNKDLLVASYDQKIDIGYELGDLSNGKVISFDRGYLSDVYSTVFEFDGTFAYIESLWADLMALRVAGTPLVLGDVADGIFGDNIDTSNEIKCVIDDITEIKARTNTTKAFTLNLLLDSPVFTVPVGIPSDLDCIQTEWVGYNRWKTHVVQAYFGNKHFVDREADTYVFTGRYILNKHDNAMLHNYWRQQRGNVIHINESDWGTSLMFGPDNPSTSHDVIITNMQYNNYAIETRDLTIELLKVD